MKSLKQFMPEGGGVVKSLAFLLRNKLVNKVNHNLCTYNYLTNMFFKTIWNCKNGKCFNKPHNSTVKPIDYACKYRALYYPCPSDKPYCKNGKCFKKPQNIAK